MGYQDKGSTTTVFAKLTKLGTERILMDNASFNIKYFAPVDDELDYRLWNPAHPDGSDYYGSQIEALPLLEPTDSHLYQCNSKLILNFDPDAERAPYWTVDPTSVHFDIDNGETQKDVHIKYGNYMGEPIRWINTNRKDFAISCAGGSDDTNADTAAVKKISKTAYWSQDLTCPAGATLHVEVGTIKGGSEAKYSLGLGASSLLIGKGIHTGAKNTIPITADGNKSDRSF